MHPVQQAGLEPCGTRSIWVGPPTETEKSTVVEEALARVETFRDNPADTFLFLTDLICRQSRNLHPEQLTRLLEGGAKLFRLPEVRQTGFDPFLLMFHHLFSAYKWRFTGGQLHAQVEGLLFALYPYFDAEPDLIKWKKEVKSLLKKDKGAPFQLLNAVGSFSVLLAAFSRKDPKPALSTVKGFTEYRILNQDFIFFLSRLAADYRQSIQLVTFGLNDAPAQAPLAEDELEWIVSLCRQTPGNLEEIIDLVRLVGFKGKMETGAWKLLLSSYFDRLMDGQEVKHSSFSLLLGLAGKAGYDWHSLVKQFDLKKLLEKPILWGADGGAPVQWSHIDLNCITPFELSWDFEPESLALFRLIALALVSHRGPVNEYQALQFCEIAAKNRPQAGWGEQDKTLILGVCGSLLCKPGFRPGPSFFRKISRCFGIDRQWKTAALNALKELFPIFEPELLPLLLEGFAAALCLQDKKEVQEGVRLELAFLALPGLNDEASVIALLSTLSSSLVDFRFNEEEAGILTNRLSTLSLEGEVACLSSLFRNFQVSGCHAHQWCLNLITRVVRKVDVTLDQFEAVVGFFAEPGLIPDRDQFVGDNRPSMASLLKTRFKSKNSIEKLSRNSGGYLEKKERLSNKLAVVAEAASLPPNDVVPYFQLNWMMMLKDARDWLTKQAQKPRGRSINPKTGHRIDHSLLSVHQRNLRRLPFEGMFQELNNQIEVCYNIILSFNNRRVLDLAGIFRR